MELKTKRNCPGGVWTVCWIIAYLLEKTPSNFPDFEYVSIHTQHRGRNDDLGIKIEFQCRIVFFSRERYLSLTFFFLHLSFCMRPSSHSATLLLEPYRIILSSLPLEDAQGVLKFFCYSSVSLSLRQQFILCSYHFILLFWFCSCKN